MYRGLSNVELRYLTHGHLTYNYIIAELNNIPPLSSSHLLDAANIVLSNFSTLHKLNGAYINRNNNIVSNRTDYTPFTSLSITAKKVQRGQQDKTTASLIVINLLI